MPSERSEQRAEPGRPRVSAPRRRRSESNRKGRSKAPDGPRFAPEGREPRQERSRATRQRLLEATIESLAEVGWDRTTVVAVAARAGVSRGAAQHHFTTRDDLVVAAVTQVREEILADLRRRVPDVSRRRDRSMAVVEMLTEIWTSTFGRAATHLWVAASTDPALRDLVLPLERQLNRDVYEVTLELLGADPSRPQVKESVGLTLELVRGIGLGALLRRDAGRRKAELAHWAAILATLDGVVGRIPL